MGVTKRAGRKKDSSDAQTASSGGGKPKPARAIFEISTQKEVGVSDLTLISKITNEAINDNLKKRFESAQIYTYIGHVLVSVNPFRDLGIYTDAVIDSYRGKNRLEAAPHVFAVAESAYYNMKSYQKNQCVIISGESGAGKTEAAKRIMQYIANVSIADESTLHAYGGSDSAAQITKEKVLATNPLLESFGNAKTLRNNNSSRFGKYLELQFDRESKPVGANITNYLLEKSRVVGQVTNERNFHIFYQFTKAASAKHRRDFDVQEPQYYQYLNRSRCLNVDGIDDISEFQDTLEAMRIIELVEHEQDSIFRMLAAILWIGNISFSEDDSGNAAITERTAVNIVARQLHVEPQRVIVALTSRVVETGRGGRSGEHYDVPLNITQATAVRDALAKAIYFNLFDWIVDRVNEKLEAEMPIANSVGILDIYGFEIFERNSFEQLCINFVNEKLQQIFIQLTLRTEQEEYAREQIQWTPIKYFDNKIVCDLIEEKRPPGVFAALNDACATAHADPGAADQTFAQRLNALSSNPHFQPRQGQFVVKHYAGDVNYAIDGMTDKNKDQLLKDLLNLLKTSQNIFVETLFPQQVNQDDKRRPPTAGDKIKASANDLVATLMKASPSYIRTIKPNDNKSPTEYNTGNVMHQIKYLGLQENVRIRRAGFAYRQTFETFFDRFFPLSFFGRAIVLARKEAAMDNKPPPEIDTVIYAKLILAATRTPREEHQMGVTKVFIKTPETLFALEKMRDRFMVNMIIRIQKCWRDYVRRRDAHIIKIQRFWREIRRGDEYRQKREYGHQILQQRKERRRFSLIGSRRYHGDYLGVSNRGGFGEVIRNAANLGGQEQVLFSCRCELLVTKFGRSSKPESRILVLTPKAVYIIVINVVNGQSSMSSERTIPLGAIKYVGTSTLKDDWFSLGVSSPQQPDPLINCTFKTEFFTHLKMATPGGGLNVRIGDSIEYNKKPGKPSVVKVVKDPSVQRDDFYKSGTIHTNQGEPPNSKSRRTPKRKPKIGELITYAKMPPRARGLGDGPSKVASRPAATRPIPPQATQPRPTPVQRQSSSIPVPQPVASKPHAEPQPLVPANSVSYKANDSRIRAPPPPPAPAAPPATPIITYKALYDYSEAGESHHSLQAGEIVEVIEEFDKQTSWTLIKKPNDAKVGYVPTAYLYEEVSQPAPRPRTAPRTTRAVPPPPPSASKTNGINGTSSISAAKAKPTPPAPPKRLGMKKPAPPPAPRDSVSSSIATSGGGSSGRDTPITNNNGSDGSKAPPSFAGRLAEELRKRETSTRGSRDEDDDW